ncbi:phage tail protein [Clostridium botulinum]|uniref:phage tail protein n=1 Tax=Clostridium botulinum TaxID=1491 RepID=UPI00224075DB|nr:phage tail protein [Clostridium botulinum]
MALFKNMAITNQGMALYAKAQAGQEIHFTKMQVGSGQIETQNPVTLLTLLNPKLDVPITSITANPEMKSATIIGNITNKDVKEAIYICELGLFAKDPDEGEILYGYVSAGQYGDYYAPEAQGPYSWQYEINAAIGNAANVTAEVSRLNWDHSVINSNKTFLHLEGGNQKEINKSIDNLFQSVKLDLADIATEIGTEKLKTNAKDIKSSINELFISASNGKTKVATAITGKGIPASGSDSYDTLSNKIKNIKTGYTQNDLINIENVEFSIKNIFSKNMDSGMLFFIKDYIYVINWKDSIKKYSLDGNLILSKKIDHNGFSSGYYTYFDDIYKIFFHNNSFYIFNKGLKHSGEYYYRVYAETCDIERISAYDFGGQGAYSYYGYGGVAINNDGICCGYNEYSGEVFLFSLSYADVIWSKCLFGWNTKYDFSNIFSDGTDFYISSNYSSGSYYKINVNGDITKLEKKSLPYESNSVMLGEYVYCYDSNKKIWRYNIKTNKTEQIGSDCKYIELDFLRKYLYIYTGSILHKINKNGNIICSYNCTDDHFLGSDKDGCIYFYNNNVINKTTLAYKVLV